MTQDEKDELFHRIAHEVADTLTKKNHDYGDSFHNQYVKFGDVSTVIRLWDKIERIESLLTKDAKVVNESIEDTLKDIAGYAILTLTSRIRIRGGLS